ncbi:Unknown protein [Striga hermonthica]|uniref:Uncharacterized protein n=1 Tax=Striga hermonthica TaxID=68872 RepID=A0A9N7RBS7_STRHE|nr:Unknown protein [Striga hermonthica]
MRGTYGAFLNSTYGASSKAVGGGTVGAVTAGAPHPTIASSCIMISDEKRKHLVICKNQPPVSTLSMSCLLSTKLLKPFCSCESPFQGVRTSLNSRRLLNHTRGAGIKHILNKHANGSMSSLNRSYHHCSVHIPTGKSIEPMFHHSGLWFSGSVQISGFWVGPDVEDGWGFVEASVHFE